MKRCVGERGVDGLGELEVDQVLAEDGRTITKRRARVLDHRRRRVYRVHAPAWYSVREQGGDAARPAPRVEYGLIAAQLQPLELLEGPAELRVADPVIRGRVPVARPPRPCAHSAVVTGPERSRVRS